MVRRCVHLSFRLQQTVFDAAHLVNISQLIVHGPENLQLTCLSADPESALCRKSAAAPLRMSTVSLRAVSWTFTTGSWDESDEMTSVSTAATQSGGLNGVKGHRVR